MASWKYCQIGIAVIILIGLIVSLIPGCDDSETPTPSKPTPTATNTPEPIASPSPVDGTFELAKSELKRESSPIVSETDLEVLVTGNNAFAFDLYNAVKGEADNLFFSPFSVSTALAMTYSGVRAETEQQMANTLHFTLLQDQLHRAFNALDGSLVSGRDDRFTLNIANSIWGQQGYPFLEEFLNVLAVNYGAGLRLLDFTNAPEPSRIVINDWVNEQTKEKIQDLIPPGAITDLTRLVLANAIYFNADWGHQFEPNLTSDAAFHLLDGSDVTVPMMSMNDPVGLLYGEGEGYQAVELPYLGYRTAMTIIVPDSGNFAEFETSLNTNVIEAILQDLGQKQVDLRLPKFSYEQSISMAGTLAEMGMPDAFDPDVADFSGMDGTKLLYITDVFHKAFVAVDEKGTEAAAATAVIIGLESMPMIDVRLVADRPFIYLIRDLDSGSILFMGRVLNPLA